jgi:hypothetical protein
LKVYYPYDFGNFCGFQSGNLESLMLTQSKKGMYSLISK